MATIEKSGPQGPVLNARVETKINASDAAKDAMRDQNFDGTGQPGKDTLDTPKVTVQTDPAAEGSQLTVNQMLGELPDQPVVTRETSEPGSIMLDKNHASATSVKYYRSSAPAFSFSYGRVSRGRFNNYWLATNDANVQFYVEHQLIGAPNSSFVVSEGTKAEYDRDHSLYGFTQPANTQASKSEGLIGPNEDVRHVALQAKPMRTEANPDLIERETGNANQDHFTNFQRLKEENLNKPVVDDRKVQAPVVSNEQVPAKDTTKPTNTEKPGAKPEVNLTSAARVGMQGSVGASSAPSKPTDPTKGA